MALEAQFPEQTFEEIRHPRVETVEDLQLAVERAKGRPAVVVYTLVKPELREEMRVLCRRAKVHYCDILGPPMASIAKVSGQGAQMKAGARPPLNSAYFKRMAAIEFAVKYDDGLGAKGLREADIVLVGVSRTSKTPVSMFLGSMGYRTANVPIVKGIAPPEELFSINPAKIVGLTIAPERLADIRRERARLMQANRQRLRRSRRGARGACRGGGDPPAARLSRDRRHRALGGGDRRAHRPHGRAAEPRAAVEPVLSEQFFDPRAQEARERRITVWRWTLWYACLGRGHAPLLRAVDPALARPEVGRLGGGVHSAAPAAGRRRL